jgi:3',5'-cyclic AMP phosphodiesterase CpdA
MVSPFRFAVISDPHIALPHTIYNSPNRFHLVEVSIPALEQILQVLESQDLDFLLIPGDLTQHGERENHEWLADRLKRLPFPTYVVPGNHDVITRDGCDRTLSLDEFPALYRAFGYDSDMPYYHQTPVPGMHLIGLNSIAFDAEGQQLYTGYVDEAQLAWLSARLAELQGEWVMVMIHHNVLEHLPNQAKHPMGRRYIVKNRNALIRHLQAGRVSLIFTGHLHVQDIAQEDNVWEVTTGSLVSYPHPYRIFTVMPASSSALQAQVSSFRVHDVENWPNLQVTSRQWMRDRSARFMSAFLSSPPFNLPEDKAQQFAPELKDFWADVCAGDGNLDYAHLPADLNRVLKTFGAVDSDGNHAAIDNNSTLRLPSPRSQQA